MKVRRQSLKRHSRLDYLKVRTKKTLYFNNKPQKEEGFVSKGLVFCYKKSSEQIKK